MPDNLFSVFQDERFMDLTIYQFGYEKCRPLHSFGPYVRNHYLFHYVISGKGTLYSDDENHNSSIYEISGDSGFLIEPGLSNMYSADKDDPWEYVWIEFGGLRSRECMEAAGLSQKTPIYVPDTLEHSQEIGTRMLSFIKDDTASPLGLIGRLYLFMDCLIRYSTSQRQIQGGKLSEFYVREVLSYIEGNYAKNITVEDMARRCKLDRSYFGKVFKKEVGQSPQEFLIRYRMTRAADLLSTTDRSIGDIGAAVGYANQLHFSRAFKSIYDMPPREYRQHNQLLKNQDK